MLARIGLSSMYDLADIDPIVQQMIESSPRIRCTSGSMSSLVSANFTADSLTLQVIFKLHDATEPKILPEKFAHRVRLFWIHNEFMIHAIITKRNDPAHPQAFFLRGGNFVP